MCHRYTLSSNPRDVAKHFDVADYATLFPEETGAAADFYPISSSVPVVRLVENGKRILEKRTWSLIPHWWRPSEQFPNWKKYLRKYSTFNAKSETVHEKRSFKDAFLLRIGGRALIPANAFFERGYIFHLPDKPIFAFAGLWNTWRGEEGEINCCTILTCPANEFVAEVHPRKRMPVILDCEESFSLWLDPSITTRDPLEALMQPYDAELMDRYEVA